MWPQKNLIVGWLELSFGTELSMGLIRKLRNRLFQNLEFCIHDATLGADLARSGCRMDMVDGALERVDVACFNPNIEFVSWCLFLLENSFEFQDFWKFPSLRKIEKNMSESINIPCQNVGSTRDHWLFIEGSSEIEANAQFTWHQVQLL